MSDAFFRRWLSRLSRRRLWVIPVLALVAGIPTWSALSADPAEVPAVTDFLQRHFQQRADALLAGKPDRVPAAEIDISTALGRWLVERERRKIDHVHQWARSRGYKLVDQKVEVKILRSSVRGSTARASVIFRQGIGYRPARSPDAPISWMGVGTSHVVELVRTDDSWQVRRDHGLDPLYEEGPPPEAGGDRWTHSPPVSAAQLAAPVGSLAGSLAAAPGKGFDRQAAARYADTFCGIAWGCGNGHRYNRQFRDFTGLGGDCANFASQTLAAGGIRPGGGWLYDPRRREATPAWINAGALVRHLVYSGKGRLIARGPFGKVAAAAGGPGLPKVGAGDIIGYEQDGDIVHVSVVAGTNADGYAVVNSHTADRYRVPWDLGWGANTRFWVIRVSR